MASRRERSAALLALGAWLAIRSRGGWAIAALVLTGLSGIGAAVAAVLYGGARATMMPALAATLVAWGGGVMLAFGASIRAVRLDREHGIRALARARGAGLPDYVRGRVGGLVVVLASAVGAATLFSCVGALVASGGSRAVLRASAGALAYALAFSLTMGPVAMAALGARTRAGGYLTLLAVLALPEILSPWTARLLPRGWFELTSIPSALGAIETGVAHPILAGAHAARAVAGLAAIVAVALLVVAARARGASAGPGREPS